MVGGILGLMVDGNDSLTHFMITINSWARSAHWTLYILKYSLCNHKKWHSTLEQKESEGKKKKIESQLLFQITIHTSINLTSGRERNHSKLLIFKMIKKKPFYIWCPENVIRGTSFVSHHLGCCGCTRLCDITHILPLEICVWIFFVFIVPFASICLHTITYIFTFYKMWHICVENDGWSRKRFDLILIAVCSKRKFIFVCHWIRTNFA